MAIAVRSSAAAAADPSTNTLGIIRPSAAGLAPAAGDLLVAVVARDEAASSATGFTCTSGGTWTSRYFVAATATAPTIAVLTRTATASEPTTYSFVSTGSSAQGQFGIHLLVLTDADTTTPIAVSPVLTTAGSATTNNLAPTITIPTGLPDTALMVCAYFGFRFNSTPNSYGWTTPTGMTEVTDLGDVWMYIAVDVEQRSSGATGTRQSSFVTRPNTTTAPSNPARAISFALRPIVTAVAPTVDAGTDATIDQYDTFSRTATEDDGGASITGRSWSVVSGPNQVGATLATTAALAWAPTVGGTYVLRYSATNSQGTDIDDVTVTANALNFPVTAPLILGASRTGAKNVTSTPSAPLVLAASRVGAKNVALSPTAPLVLGASAEGMKINLVIAPLKLSAALLNAGSSNGAFVMAPLTLGASIAGRSHISDAGVVTAPLPLAASVATNSVRTGAVTAPIVMGASLSGVVKAVSVTRSAPVTLAASVSGILHASGYGAVANLRLVASATPTSSTRNNVNRTAVLKLKALRTTSSVHFGHAGVLATPLRLRATVFGQRIVAEAKSLRPKADTTVKYEVVCVARVPQVSGPPTFIEVDPIDWTSITHNQVLNVADSVSIEVKIEKLTEPILQRLRTPHELPTEIWVRRNGKQVFAGPLLGGSVSSESLSLEAQGIEAYTKMWYVASDLDFQNVDQFTIAATLVNQWQSLDYGNFGIDTSQVGVSGVLRSLALPAAELHNVFDRIDDFTKLADGFDISVDPASRVLELYYPQRGQDRSSGEDAIIFDQRNVTSSDLAFSVAPGDLASDGLATATASGSDAPLVATFANSELRARYGRTGVTASFQSPDQGALDAATQALVQARGAVLLVPGPNARVTIDSDLSSYDVGDIIGYQAHSRLSVSGAYRVRKRVVRVAETGTESVSLEFV